MKKARYRILVADDEPKYIYLAQLNLEARGYEVLVARDGQAAVELAASQEPDLIILDIRMPILDGYQACERIRQFSSAPIIMLTAMAENADKVKGLELGADDYVTKPFSVDEFLARIKAALRRVEFAERAEVKPIFETGELRVDLAQRRVFAAGQEVPLTPIEYHLLSELTKQAERIVSSEYLLEQVWGNGYEGAYSTLRQAVYRLRQKIEPNPQTPRYIHTKPGIGYSLAAPD